MGPTEDPLVLKRSKSWNKDAYCKFHNGNGHDIEYFYKIKHLIQNMVENKPLPLLSGAKKSLVVLAIFEDYEDLEDSFPCNLLSTIFQPVSELVVPNFYHLRPQIQVWKVPNQLVTPDLEENICPLSTLKALGFSGYDLMLSPMKNLKLYGITNKVLGIKSLIFYVGCNRK